MIQACSGYLGTSNHVPGVDTHRTACHQCRLRLSKAIGLWIEHAAGTVGRLYLHRR
jgi:hypothetical protein